MPELKMDIAVFRQLRQGLAIRGLRWPILRQPLEHMRQLNTDIDAAVVERQRSTIPGGGGGIIARVASPIRPANQPLGIVPPPPKKPAPKNIIAG